MRTAVYRHPNATQPAPPAADRAHWWRSFFDQAEDALLVCAMDGTVEEANPRAIVLMGLDTGNPGVNLLDYLPPSHKTRLTTALNCESCPEQLPSVTLLVFGNLRTIADLTVTPLGDRHRLVSLKDVSRRWRMESHAQRLMTAVDATTDVVYLTDPGFNVTFVNSAFQMVTGFTIEDALGRPFDLLRAPGQDDILNACRRRLEAGMDWSGELLNRRMDDTTYPVEASISPIFDTTGECLGYAIFERDISLKQRLEKEIREERDFIGSIIDSLDSAIYTMDREFRLIHVNDFSARMPLQHGNLEWSENPRPGDCLLDAVTDPTNRETVCGALRRVLDTGQFHEFETRGGPGNRHWNVRVAPLRRSGEITGLIYKVTDRSRMHDLQMQLYQAQKMETIGALAAGVAHDFNNLLQAIRGHVTLMLMADDLAPQLGAPLRQIDQAAGRAAEITQQLLTFSRASEEQCVVLDFNDVIREASQLAARSLKKKIELVLRPWDRPACARMDATRAQQLLLNLCVNAIDAMPNGGRLTLANSVVEVSPAQAAQYRVPAGQQCVRCTVRDTGMGIPAAVLDKIFDPFFTTKAKGHGTGLGLSIVHSVVQQSGGFLEVETREGKGTAFHLHLPLADSAAVAQPASAPGRKLLRGSGRVLVVDDMDLVREFARTFLEAAGYEVEVAVSGEQAMEMLQAMKTPFDLVLTDYNMTGMTGQQLIREIREHWPSIQCILASGFLEPQERELVQTHLGARILNKPFNIREAADLIAEMLSSRG